MADPQSDAKTTTTHQIRAVNGATNARPDVSRLTAKTRPIRRPKKRANERGFSTESSFGTDPEPWPEPVNGAVLLDEITAAIKRHVSLPTLAAELIALWGVATHSAKSTPIFPRLLLTSIDAASGKSLVLEILSDFCFRPAAADDMTPAVIFRLVDAMKPTLLLDEADTWLGEEFRGLMNSGYKRSGAVWRCDGDDHIPREFSTYAPAVIARIGTLSKVFGPLLTRSIAIRMSRMLPDERLDPYVLKSRVQFSTFCRKSQRWLRDVKLMDPRPEMPPVLRHRDADNWRFLFAIAEAAGGEWPATAQQVALHFTKNAPASSNVDRRGFLAATKSILVRLQQDRIKSVDLCEKLGRSEDFEIAREFRNLNERKAGRVLGKYLADFPEIPRPRKLRIDGGTYQGYETAPFFEVFQRYGIRSAEEEDADMEH
jgi:putative DNA primase/helicase